MMTAGCLRSSKPEMPQKWHGLEKTKRVLVVLREKSLLCEEPRSAQEVPSRTDAALLRPACVLVQWIAPRGKKAHMPHGRRVATAPASPAVDPRRCALARCW